jgi:hypothetical protein
MEALLLWPDRPGLSLLVLWAASVVVLWAAREPMTKLLTSLGGSLEDGLRVAARWCRARAEDLRRRGRTALLAAGGLELQGRLEREFHRIEGGFSDRLSQYSELHRRLDDLLQRLDADYQQCGDSPPELPGWAATVEAIAGLPASSDPNVHRVLEGVRKSLRESEKRSLQTYREDTARRHRILGSMRTVWKDVRSLLARTHDAVHKALQTAHKVNAYVDEYDRIRNDDQAAARALVFSASKLFTISLLVLGIALGGAFVNFQLIALPMSELVPAGARLGGVPVATISALVIVLMEIAVGIFVLDMLGITELFPRLAGIPASRRRLVLGVALGGLFFLSAVESSLAVLREVIVEADAALKLALAGEASPVAQASTSPIPVVGQAVLGFVLPWILALVAIPLEMLLDSGRHVATVLVALVLSALGALARVGAHAVRIVSGVLPNLYDAYVSIPLRLEKALRERREVRVRPARAGVREESLA